MSKVKNAINTFEKCFKGGGSKVSKELERTKDRIEDEAKRAVGKPTSNDEERAKEAEEKRKAQMKKLKEKQAQQKKEKSQQKKERGRAALEDAKAKRFTKKQKDGGGGSLVTGAGMETGLAPQDTMGKDEEIDPTKTYKMTKKKKDD